jgi:hypothetical protein
MLQTGDIKHEKEEAESELEPVSCGTWMTTLFWIGILLVNLYLIANYGAPTGKTTTLAAQDVNISGITTSDYAVYRTPFATGYMIEMRDTKVNQGKRCIAGGFMAPAGGASKTSFACPPS